VLWIAAYFVLSRAVIYALGVRFWAGNHACEWHFLPPELLKEDLLGSIWRLHTQPPLFNFFLGTGLNLFADPVPFFHFCFLASSLALLLMLYRALREAGISPRPAGIAVALFGLNPSLILFENYFFYPLWEACFVTGGLLCLQLYARTKETRWIAGFSAFAAALLFTRASFHPVWFFIVALGLTSLFSLRGKEKVILSLPLAASLLWMTKNWSLIGVFAISSALGMGTMKNTLLNVEPGELRQMIEQREISALALEAPFASAHHYANWTLATPPAGHRSLDWEGIEGCHNPNHRSLVGISRQMGEISRTVLRKRPEAYLATLGDAASLFFSSSASYEVPAVRLNQIAGLERVYAAVLSPRCLIFLFFLIAFVGLFQCRRHPALFFCVATIF